MSSNINKISATKQFKRLFAGPLDPSMSWDSMIELQEYLKSPICYTNQIIGCQGKAYIISESNGEKVLVEIGTGGGSGGDGSGSGGGTECNCDFTELWNAVNGKAEIVHRHELSDIDLSVDGESIVIPGFHIGPEPPSDTSLLWIDTTEKELDLRINSQVLEEFRNTLTGMNNLILELRKEVAELKDHTCDGTNNPSETLGYYLMTEDGFNLITEDGFSLVSEDFYNGVIDNGYSILTEDGYSIVTEDGYVLVTEDYIEGIYDNDLALLTEDGLYLSTEDGYVLISEEFIDNAILTEDNEYLITELGETIEASSLVAYSNERRTDLRTFLSECGKCEKEKQEIVSTLTTKADIDHRHKPEDVDNFPELSELQIMAKYHIGEQPPEDPNKLWIDTSNGHISQTIDMTIIDEISTMIARMAGKINELDKEIIELRGKYNKN